MKLVLSLLLVFIAASAQAATVHGAVASASVQCAKAAQVSVKDAAKVGSYPVRHPKRSVKAVGKAVVSVVKHL